MTRPPIGPDRQFNDKEEGNNMNIVRYIHTIEQQQNPTDLRTSLRKYLKSSGLSTVVWYKSVKLETFLGITGW